MIDSAMQSPVSDTSHATARHVLEAGKVASVAGDVPSPSVFELAASEPKSSAIAHSQHLSVPVSELSASPHHSMYTTTNPHASMPISELSEGSEARTPEMSTPQVGHGVDGLAVEPDSRSAAGAQGGVESAGGGGGGRFVSSEMGEVGGWWEEGEKKEEAEEGRE